MSLMSSRASFGPSDLGKSFKNLAKSAWVGASFDVGFSAQGDRTYFADIDVLLAYYQWLASINPLYATLKKCTVPRCAV